jgi:hypothetical protein
VAAIWALTRGATRIPAFENFVSPDLDRIELSPDAANRRSLAFISFDLALGR